MASLTRILILAATMVAASSCGGDGGDASAQPSADERLAAASQGLCDALELAEADDVTGAGREFEDRVHAYLHDLAAQLSTFDRPAAGELLEAKQRVEEALRGTSPDAAEVHALIADLQRELADAADAAGLQPSPCEEVLA